MHLLTIPPPPSHPFPYPINGYLLEDRRMFFFFDKIGSLVSYYLCVPWFHCASPANLSEFYLLIFSPPFLSSFFHLKVRIIRGTYRDRVVIFKSIHFTSPSGIILSLFTENIVPLSTCKSSVDLLFYIYSLSRD